jgi:hypothetical protein
MKLMKVRADAARADLLANTFWVSYSGSEAMTHTGSRPAGGGFKDYMSCGVCGNTGFVKRSGEQAGRG